MLEICKQYYADYVWSGKILESTDKKTGWGLREKTVPVKV